MENLKKIKLDIGSGRPKFEDYITIDNDLRANPAILCDIDGIAELGGYKAELAEFEGKTDEIRAFHILEHLKPENKTKVMRLFYELLKPGGILHIEVPIAGTAQFWQDPTHLSGWTERTFWYFTKDNKFGEGFKNRNSDVRLFEFVEDETRKDWAYRIKFKKPNK